MIENMAKKHPKVAVPAGQIKTMFAAADTDGSGCLEFEEFQAAFDQHLRLAEVLEMAREFKVLNDCLGQLFLLVFLIYMYPSSELVTNPTPQLGFQGYIEI